MKRIFLLAFILLIGISFVFAAQENVVSAGSGDENQEDTETQTQNQGIETHLQNQVRVQSGMYINSNGEQMQIQNENQFRLQIGGVEAVSDLEVSSEYDSVQNRTRLKTQLSNGNNAEVKVMPNTASETAMERLRLKLCSSENNCSLELKEVGNGEQAKLAYEVQAQQEAKVFAIFRTRMRVQAQVDAETGEIIQARRPWWAFLATTE